MMSIGWRSVSSMSKITNLNPRSSMKAELIGEGNVIAVFVWLRCFIEVQGFEGKYAFMYQENLSSTILDNNGRLSGGNFVKQICVGYFLIKYIIAMGNLKNKYSPTGKLLANHFTKPLKGDAF